MVGAGAEPARSGLFHRPNGSLQNPLHTASINTQSPWGPVPVRPEEREPGKHQPETRIKLSPAVIRMAVRASAQQREREREEGHSTAASLPSPGLQGISFLEMCTEPLPPHPRCVPPAYPLNFRLH